MFEGRPLDPENGNARDSTQAMHANLTNAVSRRVAPMESMDKEEGRIE